VAALLAAGFLALHQVDLEIERTVLESRETHHAEMGKESLATDLETIAADVLILAQSDEFKGGVELAELRDKFLVFSKQRRFYDQVRFLDAAGMEAVRVNFNGGKPAIVPDSLLQDKSKRYYFGETIAMAGGEVYISDLDLNIEQGRIEQPLKPVLRVGTPVFGEGDDKIGVVLVNYLGARTIGRFDEALASSAGEAHLLNGDGFWLRGPRAEDEWGFMFGNKRSFAAAYPEAWRRIKASRTGQFITAGGLFTFTTFSPREFIESSSVEYRGKRFRKIVTRVDPGKFLLTEHARHHPAWMLMFLSLLGLSALGCWHLGAARVGRRAEQAVRESEERWRGFADASFEGLLIHDSGVIIDANDRFADMFGYGLDEQLRGTNFLGLVAPETLQTVREKLLAQVTGTFEAVGLGKDGSTFPMELSAHPIAYKGQTQRAVAVRDLSERKKAERMLRESMAMVNLMHSVAVAANEAASVEEAIKTCLDNVCAYTWWPVGHAYVGAADDPDRLVATDIWCLRHRERFNTFVEITKTTEFKRGEDLPGRVLASGEPAWIADLPTDPNFPRAAALRECGIKSGFALPVLAERQVVAVLEFFTDETAAPDQSLLPVLLQIGTSLGRVFERVRAGRALRESEERKGSILQGALDGIVSIDEQGKVVEFNPAAEAMFGYRLGEVAGKDIADLIVPPDQRQKHRGGLKRFLKTGKSKLVGKRVELTATRAGGGEFPVELSITHLKEHGLFTAFIRDITVRKKAEESMRLSATVFDTVSQGIMVTDAGNSIVAVNPAFTEITGFTADEAIGQNPGLLKSGHHGKAFYKDMWESINETGMWTGEIWNRRKSGEIFPGWLTIGVVRDAGGMIAQYIAVFIDITKRKETEDLIFRQANYDALTKLPNRKLFFDRLTQAMAVARREDKSFGLLYVDLDRFKLVNDTLGHAMGDDLLVDAARRLNSSVRASDTVGRLGGDEFTVIVPGIDKAIEAEVVARKILKTFERPFDLGGDEVLVTASVGIAVFPHDADAAETLLRNADSAMYRAKEGGRDTFRFFMPKMNAGASDRMSLERDLRHAMEREELQVHYQPIVDLASQHVIGAEALIRWRHPERGLVPPDKFIPLAEETGLINQIGEWVLRTACRQAKEWNDIGPDPIFVTVNMSGRQMTGHGFIDLVCEVLEETGLAPQSLHLEITESILMDDIAESTVTLEGLHAIGIPLSIDDFGTGFSSLSYLKKFPFSILKIDRSFIRGLLDDTDDAALTQAIIAMADGLKIETVAEGVETHGQHEFLQSRKCLYGQGYHFSQAVPAEEFLAYVVTVNDVSPA
jgi:diguanylate cyclase (GGDEF)-like protein/PAS domain S-box-containing protein